MKKRESEEASLESQGPEVYEGDFEDLEDYESSANSSVISVSFR